MRKWLPWLLIILLGLSWRIYRLDRVPVHLSNDEISIAWDAYSVARSGKDEHGHLWPISFQSHSTYKAPLYAYILVPLTLIAPNNEYIARLPSAILGTATILIMGLIIWELSSSYLTGLIGGVILALTPWHIFTSRMALESNIALFFLLLGMWMIIKARGVRRWWLLLGGLISMALSMYGYHTEWLLTPMIMGLIWWVYYRNSKIYRKEHLVLLVILWGVSISPLVGDAIRNLKTGARANSEVIWKEIHLEATLRDPKISGAKKMFVLGRSILSNYGDYINPDYLFVSGLRMFPEPYITQPGLLMLMWLPFLVVGLFGMKTVYGKNSQLILGWLLVSPIVPALTQGGTNLVRYLPMVLPLTALITGGVVIIWRRYKEKAGWITALGLVVSSGYFGINYFFHFPIHSGINFQYGYRQIANYLKINYNQYEKIVVEVRFGETNRFVGVPHLYLPYYLGLPPEAVYDRQKLTDGEQIDKLVLKQINWHLEEIKKGVLYVVPMGNKPLEENGLELVKDIQYPDAEPGYFIYRLK